MLILTLTLYNPSTFDASVLSVCWFHGGDLWLCTHSMMVYWCFNLCRYSSHFATRLYYMVLGGIITIVCMSTWVTGVGFSLWLIMMIVVVF